MQITKFLHSCLLVEEADKTILFNPGNFTYDAKVFAVNILEKLDYLLITHEHPDHCYPPFIKEILQKFPDVKIISNQSVVELLKKENITASADGDEIVKITPVPHGRVFDREAPANVMFEVFDRLADPGDSLDFTTAKEILALPLLGPSWTVTHAAEKAVELKPKIVVPIHDWHWKDEARKDYYKRLTNFFAEKGIVFKPLETGEIIEV